MKVLEEPSLPESTKVAPPADSGARGRVLLAEDDRALRRFLEVVLDPCRLQSYPGG